LSQQQVFATASYSNRFMPGFANMTQGPVACVRLREVSLGRSASAKKAAAGVASAVTSFRPRIPLNCRGVELHLRVPPPLPPGQKPQGKRNSLTAGPSAPEQAAAAAAVSAARQRSASAEDSPAERGTAAQSAAVHPVVLWARTAASSSARGLAAAARWLAAHLPPLPIGLPLRMAGSMALQLLLALMPSVPLRIKDIVVSFEVTLCTMHGALPLHDHAVAIDLLMHKLCIKNGQVLRGMNHCNLE
jgi:hypothetical protein